MKAQDLALELANKKNIVNILGTTQRLFKRRGCMHWSEMTGKMYGKRAIGRPMTSRCLDNQKLDGCICQKCYATKLNLIYPSMANALQRNRDIDNEEILLNPPIFTDNGDPTWRSNWNGDYEDEHDVAVDFDLCYQMPDAICTAWTKNLESVYHMDKFRPDNFTLMQSSYFINEPEDLMSVADQVFTIYTAEYAAENDVDINCIGACRLCKRCYGEKSHRPKEVNELLKGEETKYLRLMGLDL